MAHVTKKELLELVRRKAEKTYSNAEVDDILTSFSEVLTEELQHGNEVTLKDVGTWSLSVRGARTGRNPRTGETIEIDEKVFVRYKAARPLRMDIADLDPDQFREDEPRPKQRKPQKADSKKPAREASGRRNRR